MVTTPEVEMTRFNIAEWVVTLILSVTATVAGAAMVAPVCYWMVRLGQPETDLAAYRPQATPIYVLTPIAATVWIAIWALRLARRKDRGGAIVHSIVPAVVFAWAAWRASILAWPCNPF